MNIGVLTFWGVPNYGAFAQAYALNAVLRQLGHAAEHIAYLHPRHRQLYAPPSMRPAGRLWRPLAYWRLYRERCRKRAYRARFLEDLRHIPHTPDMTASQLREARFECVITGSDAIWEFSIPEFGADPLLIGNDLKCARRVAYAASFGMMTPADAFPAFVAGGLRQYDFIAVRDDNSADIVERLIGTRPPIALDPSLLWDFANDPVIPAPRWRDGLLVYSAGFDDATIRQLKEYAARRHLPLVGAGIPHPWCDRNLSPLRPTEWIALFRQARAVATSTFHGLMFALAFRRPLMFRMAPYVKNRCSWLLRQIGLLDRFASPSVPVEELLSLELDYAAIGSKLDELRSASMAFLNTALKAAPTSE